MIVPNYVDGPIVDDKGYPTSGFANFLQSLLKNMNAAISDEGFVISNVTAAQQAVLQASFQSAATPVDPSTQTVKVGAAKGTLIFDTDTANGGAPGVPNGQLYILLGDGTFHAIANL